MIEPKIIDELAKKLSDSMPESMKVLQHDFEKNMRAVLQSTLGKLNLVTREEFDIQSAVLARTEEQVRALAEQVAILEQTVAVQKDSDA